MDMQPKKTSWGGVAEWYDEVLKDPDSYQKKILMPNLIRLVDPKKGMTIVDNACGQGYFARAFANNGATVIAADISKELISLAAADHEKNPHRESGVIKFYTTPADKLQFIPDATVDVVTVVLALQNIENISAVFAECSRVLKVGGRMIFVINHPAFRIPQSSDWGWDDTKGKQYRRMDAYMSDKTFSIDMTPGEKVAHKKKITFSFHRPLQTYFKAMNKSGLAVTRLEEWISHKKSQEGPRAAEEDRMRKEIPLFLMVEAKKG
jgi:ubiquinone/menaquinone biosynthesis C-methylase UbiE